MQKQKQKIGEKKSLFFLKKKMLANDRHAFCQILNWKIFDSAASELIWFWKRNEIKEMSIHFIKKKINKNERFPEVSMNVAHVHVLMGTF